MRRLPVIANNEAPICAECGGACCKRAPGIYSPEDFGAPDRAAMADLLYKRLSSGLVTIDWWEGDPRTGKTAPGKLWSVDFIRPAQVEHEGKLRHPTWGGQCALFAEGSGCILPFEERPFQCRAFEPGKHVIDEREGCDGEFPTRWLKRGMTLRWLPYADVIAEVAARVEKERCHA